MDFDLKELRQEMPHKWRVQSFSRYKAQAACIAYVDSRQVQDLLDSVVGPENWQDTYEEIFGDLYCHLSIKCNDEWVTKTDCGIYSKTEKEKGRASDAFKRAAVKWGIGRFLYALKIQYVDANEKSNGNNKPYPVFNNGNRIYDLTEHLGGNKTVKQSKPEKREGTKSVSKKDYAGYTPKQFKKEKMATEAQRKKMFAMGCEAFDNEDAVNQLKGIANELGLPESSKDYTKEHINLMFSTVEKIIKNKTTGETQKDI